MGRFKMAFNKETQALRNMILTFRVSELQMLLGFAGRNQSGKKTELQDRALELLKLNSTPVQKRIRELFQSSQETQQAQQHTATGKTHNQGEEEPRLHQGVNQEKAMC